MDSIVVTDHIPEGDYTPSNLSAISINDWYEDEAMTFTEPADASARTIGWLLAQGWEIVSTVTENTDETNPLTGEPIQEITYDLTRRVLDPEKGLDDLIEDFVAAYNDGREINDDRFDDIMALYSATLDKTQTALDELYDDDEDFESLIEYILTEIEAYYWTHKDNVVGLYEDYENSEEDRIKDEYDARLSAKQSNMIDRGLTSTTALDSAEDGVEHNRQKALSDFNDRMVDRKINLQQYLHKANMNLHSNILNARQRLRDALYQREYKSQALREKIVEAAARFAERRTDAYPDLGDIGKLVSEIGTGTPSGMGQIGRDYGHISNE